MWRKNPFPDTYPWVFEGVRRYEAKGLNHFRVRVKAPALLWMEAWCVWWDWKKIQRDWEGIDTRERVTTSPFTSCMSRGWS